MKNGLLCFVMLVVGCNWANAQERVSNIPIIKSLHAKALQVRQNRGLAEYTLDEECCVISQRWAEAMAASNNMVHGGGENIIARGYANEDAVINGWLSSPPHRAFVLGSYLKAGWGVARSASGQLFWAGTFRNSNGGLQTFNFSPVEGNRRKGIFKRKR